MNAAMENLLHRAGTLVARRLHDDLQDVASPRATVDVSISRVNRHAIDEALVLGEGAVEDGKLALGNV